MSDLAMRNRIEVSGRAINVEGTAKDSVTRQLAKGQEGARVFVGEFLEAEDTIIRNDTLNEKGTKEKIREAAEATVERLRKLFVTYGPSAKSQLKRLEKDLKIVDDDDELDVRIKIYLWEKLGAMDKSTRYGAVTKAFADGNTPVIRAVLDWEASLNEPFDPNLVAEWKSEYAKARNPKLAREFATLQKDIGKFEFDVEQAIRNVSEHVGIKSTLAGRMKAANDDILESQSEADAA